MSNRRNISFLIPRYLLDQISNRAIVNGRSRNAEIRYLLLLGLQYAGNNDTSVKLPSDDWGRCIGRIDAEIEDAVAERSRLYQRSLGREIVRLLAYAIKVSTDRDLEVIAEMMLRQGQSSHVPE